MASDKVAAAGYIVTYFNDIESLTNAFSNYNNLIFELKNKYKDALENNTIEKLPDSDKTNLLTQVQNTRFWVTRTYVKTTALDSSIKELKIDKLKEKYKAVIDETVIINDKLEDYVIELNKVFVKGVVVDLIEKAGDVYSQLGGSYE